MEGEQGSPGMRSLFRLFLWDVVVVSIVEQVSKFLEMSEAEKM